MQDKWNLFIKEFIEYGGYLTVLDGLRVTVLIPVCGLLIGILIGTIIAITKVVPQYKFVARFFSRISDIYVGVFRGTPIVVQLLLAYYVICPLIGVKLGSLNTCVIVFGLNSGAYVSEMMRAGIQSVDYGQMEAGRALGMSYFATMMKIIVPQAVKNILPTLGNEFIALIKDTSVASFVAAVDLYKVFTEIGTSNYEYLVPYLAMALIYIILVLLIRLLFKIIEKYMRRSDRT